MEEPQCETKPTRLGRRLNGKCGVGMKTVHITAPSSAPGGHGCQTLAPLLGRNRDGQAWDWSLRKNWQATQATSPHFQVSKNPSFNREGRKEQRKAPCLSSDLHIHRHIVHVHLHSHVDSHTHIKKKRNSTFVVSQFRLSPPRDTVYDWQDKQLQVRTL